MGAVAERVDGDLGYLFALGEAIGLPRAVIPALVERYGGEARAARAFGRATRLLYEPALRRRNGKEEGGDAEEGQG